MKRLAGRIKRFKLVFSSMFLGVAVAASTASAAPKYSIVDLGTLPGTTSSAATTAINDRGQVVGQETIDGELHAFLMTPMPEPGAMIAWAVLAAAGLGCKKLQARNRGD